MCPPTCPSTRMLRHDVSQECTLTSVTPSHHAIQPHLPTTREGPSMGAAFALVSFTLVSFALLWLCIVHVALTLVTSSGFGPVPVLKLAAAQAGVRRHKPRAFLCYSRALRQRWEPLQVFKDHVLPLHNVGTLRHMAGWACWLRSCGSGGWRGGHELPRLLGVWPSWTWQRRMGSHGLGALVKRAVRQDIIDDVALTKSGHIRTAEEVHP